ncbi:MAG: hypothetical protein GX625_16335 [Clostridiaceae bacterium]|jgi:hypothetical protein|nr:hypothetical protein [Clostridiaceae bacterium]
MKSKRRLGDRYDGRRLRTLDPFSRMIPYIMKKRSESQNLFDETISIAQTEKYLHEMRRGEFKKIGYLHIIIAAIVRTLALKPGLNRFIAGGRIYARNEILISLVIKKQLNEESPETSIKLNFNPTDTIFDVAEKINSVIEENKKEETSNNADKAVGIFNLCPGFLLRFLVWFLTKLDSIGCLPRIIADLSPFHSSVFVTDLGSLGVKPVFHHLFEFGTNSIFIAFGIKQREKNIHKDGSHIISERKTMNIKIVTDDRITDGFYFAQAFKLFRSLLQSPEQLELPPEQVIEDIV